MTRNYPNYQTLEKMDSLELRFIGNLEVLKNGEPQPLPPSKKTRALLAYLAISSRSFPREHLCELLWEIPDDPRGSLRWSLSKIRKLVDFPDHPHLEADRNSVCLNIEDVEIDVLDLQSLNGRLDTLDAETLISSLSRFQGNFLEGMELSNFHAFHAWCISQRESVNQSQASLLQRLVKLLKDSPSEALPWARQLVTQLPYSEEDRADLIMLLNQSGLSKEAEQQFHLGTRMLQEVGQSSSDVLFNAWRGVTRATVEETATSAGHVPPRSKSVLGRSDELANLQGIFKKDYNEKLALVTGMPGIGKSHLLQSLAADFPEALVLSARAYESEKMRPFGIWLDALANSDTASEVLDPGATDRERLFAGLSQLINAEAAQRNVLLLLDDMHWSDESSIAALHYILRSSKHLPVYAVITARNEELRDNSALSRAIRELKRDELLLEVKLGPLDDESLTTLIEQSFPDIDIQDLIGRCNGNPLFALELAHVLDAGSISESMDDLIRERLSQFDAEGEEILQWSALLSPRIEQTSIAEVSGIDPQRVEGVLAVGLKEGILTENGIYLEFSHDLIGKGVYSKIPPARQRNMHRSVARLIESRSSLELDQAADLAYHAAQSGDPALAARAMVAAGKLCLRFFANDDAKALANQGLTWAEDMTGPESINITIELHEVLMSAGAIDDWQSRINEYIRLAESAIDSGSRGHAQIAYHMASYQRWIHGDWSKAREQTLEGERVTRGGSEEEHINGLAETGKCLAMIERDLAKADAMLMEAHALARRQRISSIALNIGRGILFFHENRFDEADDLFREAVSLCKTAGDRINEFLALEYLVMIALEQSDLDGASSLCRKLCGIGERLGEGSEGPCSRALASLCFYETSDDSTGLESALSELRIADAKHRLAFTLNRAALIDVDRDRIESASKRANEALGYATLLQRNSESLISHVILASISDRDKQKKHREAIDFLISQPVAAWARDKAENLEQSS